MLTKERLKELFNYDMNTGHFVRKMSTAHNARKGDIAGYKHNAGSGLYYVQIVIDKKKYYAHRLAFVYVDGMEYKDVLEVDHQDGDGMNNAWENLNQGGRRKNKRNVKLYATNKTGISGVGRLKSGKFRVRISSGGVSHLLGVYADFLTACCVRKSAENKMDFHSNHGKIRMR